MEQTVSKIARARIHAAVQGTPPYRWAAARTRRMRSAALIRASGLFDEAWYAEQIPQGATLGRDLLDHYLSVGAALGLSPNPCFDAEWYRATHGGAQRTANDPFTHFIGRGLVRGDAPHPLFAAKWYLDRNPGAEGHRGGALGHYLDRGWKDGAEPHPDFSTAAYRRAHGPLHEPAFLHFARRTGRLLLETRGYPTFVRALSAFDAEAAGGFMTRILSEYEQLNISPPSVSVVLPTKDRRELVVHAVRSVIAQSYANWQLIVVDDGSRDGTLEELEPFLADPRIELVHRGVPGGVSVARNAGLARARGDYVAYLDSDNTWVPEFLEVMVAFLSVRGLRAGYAVSELKGTENHVWRGSPFHLGALRERNYIDCIALVHERSLLDEVGVFDESLRRLVDWDLLLRIAERTELELAPFVGTIYDAWEDRSDRLTNVEGVGFRYVVKAKHMLDWKAAADPAARLPGMTSVVIPSHGRASDTQRCVEALYEATDGKDFQVVVVDNGSGVPDFYRLQMLSDQYPRLRVVRSSENLGFALGATLGALRTQGEYLIILSSACVVRQGWVEPLLRPLVERSAVATQPLLLRPDGTVMLTGLAFPRRGLPFELFADFPGDAPEVMTPGDRSALSGACLAVRADDFIAARGFDPMFINGLEDADLSLRLARRGTVPLRFEPESVVVHVGDWTRGRTRHLAANAKVFLQRWSGHLPDTDDRQRLAPAGLAVAGYSASTPDADHKVHVAHRPMLVRDRRPRPRRWAIKIGPNDVFAREKWGDWHFARALKVALELRGEEAVIDCRSAWYRPTAHLDDVVLVLRGVREYVPNPQHINLLWLISHPDDVAPAEVNLYDHAFVASTTYAESLAGQCTTPVEPLLQCTDPARFNPRVEKSPQSHGVVFVGNSRGVMRTAVRDGLAAGLDLAVYGAMWEGKLPEGVVRGAHVPNEQLAGVYRAAGAVLNDHWDDMRRHGFVSNRLFDAVACGARVVSDPIAGLESLFGGVVRTYSTPAELAAGVRALQGETAEDEQRRLAAAARVQAEHSFDARAGILLKAVERLGTGVAVTG